MARLQPLGAGADVPRRLADDLTAVARVDRRETAEVANVTVVTSRNDTEQTDAAGLADSF